MYYDVDYSMSVYENDISCIYDLEISPVIDNDILMILSDFVRIWPRLFQKISQNVSGSGNDILGEHRGPCLILIFS